MQKSMFITDGEINHHSFSSQRHVSYRWAIYKRDSPPLPPDLSCGSCGYELNLNSSNRNTSTIGSKYGKSIKRGIISFFNIDESRFTQVDEFQCIPYLSKFPWGLFRGRTKLLCRKCGNHIGTAYESKTPAYRLELNGSDSSSGNEASRCRKYDVRIRALQPSSGEESGTPLFT